MTVLLGATICAGFDLRCELLVSGGLDFCQEMFFALGDMVHNRSYLKNLQPQVIRKLIAEDFLAPAFASSVFHRMQFINMHWLVGERTIDGADQFEPDQISAFGAPWKNLIFADCHRVRETVVAMDDAIDSACGHHLTRVVCPGRRHLRCRGTPASPLSACCG